MTPQAFSHFYLGFPFLFLEVFPPSSMADRLYLHLHLSGARLFRLPCLGGYCGPICLAGSLRGAGWFWKVVKGGGSKLRGFPNIP